MRALLRSRHRRIERRNCNTRRKTACSCKRACQVHLPTASMSDPSLLQREASHNLQGTEFVIIRRCWANLPMVASTLRHLFDVCNDEGLLRLDKNKVSMTARELVPFRASTTAGAPGCTKPPPNTQVPIRLRGLPTSVRLAHEGTWCQGLPKHAGAFHGLPGCLPTPTPTLPHRDATRACQGPARAHDRSLSRHMSGNLSRPCQGPAGARQ